MAKIGKLSLVIAMTIFVASCAETSENAAEEHADTAVAMPEQSMDYSGTWNMTSVPQSGNTDPVNYQIQVAGDQWTIMLPGRDPMQMMVTMAGDSVITEAGPYESVIRKGVMVSTRTSLHATGDQMSGVTRARYQTTGADSVVMLTTQGTRTR